MNFFSKMTKGSKIAFGVAVGIYIFLVLNYIFRGILDEIPYMFHVFFLVIFGTIIFVGLAVKGVEKPKKPKNKIPQKVIDKSFDETLDQMVKGELDTGVQTDLMLKKGERVVFVIPSIKLCEERTVKIKGGSAGVSVRVMKGVSFRTGGFEATMEKEMVVVDEGKLTLTNKRLAFNGSQKNNDTTLDKISSLTPTYEGIIVTRAGKQKNECYVGTNNITMSLTISPDEGDKFDKATVDFVLTGEEVKTLIQRLLEQEGFS